MRYVSAIALALLLISCVDAPDDGGTDGTGVCVPETAEVTHVRYAPAFMYGDCYTEAGAWLATAAMNADVIEFEVGESGVAWFAVEGAELNGIHFSCEAGIQLGAQ